MRKRKTLTARLTITIELREEPLMIRHVKHDTAEYLEGEIIFNYWGCVGAALFGLFALGLVALLVLG